MSYSTATNVSFWSYINDDAFEADYPVDALQAWLLQNNLAHLMDSAGQFRISWCGGKRADSPTFSGTTADTHYWSQSFPVTMWSQNYTPGLDIRIGVAVQSITSCTVNARIVPAVGRVWDSGNTPIWEGSGSASSTTGAWVIDEDTQGTLTEVWKRGLLALPVSDGGASRMSAIVALRLEVEAVVTAPATYSVYLCGVQVREFPIWW